MTGPCCSEEEEEEEEAMEDDIMEIKKWNISKEALLQDFRRLQVVSLLGAGLQN